MAEGDRNCLRFLGFADYRVFLKFGCILRSQLASWSWAKHWPVDDGSACRMVLTISIISYRRKERE
jgi:hypothetical protein